MAATEKAVKRILIVEDDTDIREVLSQVLEFEGYAVHTVGNGQEALEHLQSSERPGLILLDLMMPVMDGWHFREQQQRNSQWATIPVVILSADGNAHQKAATLQAASYLKKPVDLETLLHTVGRHCLS